jgi:peptidoglycan/xylan/chitin deacetylase (PgdA/CDA1 family)
MYSLIYHDVIPRHVRDASGFPGRLAARYKLSRDDFARHLDAIAAVGATVGTIEDDPPPAVALTFDDGGASSLYIADELERHGWNGHFFFTTGRIDSPGFLSKAGVDELARRGHVVGSHSHTHPTYMGMLSPAELAYEWQRSRQVLGDLLGHPPCSASVAGGFVSRSVLEEAERAGYGVLMTSDPVSRVRHVGRMAVLGRYSIWSTTPPATAAGYASGDWYARGRLWLEWSCKQRLKRVSPRLYEAGRRVRACL